MAYLSQKGKLGHPNQSVSRKIRVKYHTMPGSSTYTHHNLRFKQTAAIMTFMCSYKGENPAYKGRHMDPGSNPLTNISRALQNGLQQLLMCTFLIKLSETDSMRLAWGPNIL